MIAPGRTRAGFTLLEVLLAIALGLVLGGGVLGFTSDLMRTRERTLGALADLQAGDALLGRLETDLMTAVSASREGAGIVGSRDRLVVLGRQVVPAMVGGVGRLGLGDLQGTEVRFEAREGRVRAGRFDGARGDGRLWDVSTRVRWLRFRYFDGAAWAGTFDSGAFGGLPKAVEVAIWFESEGERRDREETLRALGASGVEGRERESAIERMEGEGGALEMPTRQPDRVRVIAIPDGGLDDDVGGGR